LHEAVEKLKLEGPPIAKIYMSTRAWVEVSKMIPARAAHEIELLGPMLIGIPIFIDDITGYSLVALDSSGVPVWIIK
jgi:hypothetical protein